MGMVFAISHSLSHPIVGRALTEVQASIRRARQPIRPSQRLRFEVSSKECHAANSQATAAIRPRKGPGHLQPATSIIKPSLRASGNRPVVCSPDISAGRQQQGPFLLHLPSSLRLKRSLTPPASTTKHPHSPSIHLHLD